MIRVNDEMKALLKSAMWVLATADSSGVPNAVPIHFNSILDDTHLMLVDNFMNKTIANIQANPQVSISVWDSTSGYQFKGRASLEKSGANYELAVELVKDKPFKPKGVVIVEVDSIYLTTPGPNAGNKVE
ncbi:hypothetical protein ASZ90_018422 [hydrocarbon metagenome]|uniref:Pyridoxamine 5'-phosphate oxidase N-terminal domain-containing protein n=1 Tax=hydrocarbon metagenome TaxID=938273 RepID=A0A0W8E6C8_9ZZZZ